jgi:hypothetical protein
MAATSPGGAPLSDVVIPYDGEDTLNFTIIVIAESSFKRVDQSQLQNDASKLAATAIKNRGSFSNRSAGVSLAETNFTEPSAETPN